MVMVTTFASNVARIDSIAKIAEECGRKVVLAGRSLWRIVHAAQAAGYLKDCPEFYEDDALSRFSRDQLLILCTGCQGEPLAATNKVVNGTHRSISLRPDDTVIFSSKIIPGNDKRIFRQFNKLAKLGVTVLTEKECFVHVSGHPNQDDMKRMYELVRPEYSMPVHGEDVHMVEHCRLAEQWGVKKAMKMENGQLVRLGPGTPEKLYLVDSGVLAVDGNSLLDVDSPILKMRRKLQFDGIVFVSVLLDKNGLRRTPIVTAPGVLDSQSDQAIIHELVEEVEMSLEELFGNPRAKKSWKRVEQVIRSSIRRVIRSETGKEPFIEVAIDEY
jgi:ribonuclease J